MAMMPPINPKPGDEDLPYWWNAATGKLFRPDEARQEVVANGVDCGFQLQYLANQWSKGAGIGEEEAKKLPHGGVKYPVDYFPPVAWDTEGREPVRAPDTKTTKHYKAENHPILAWVVHPNKGSVAVVIDSLEKTDSPYADCKVIQGTPEEVLPLEIRKEMGLP
jgi:hypothetical protein